MAQIDVNPLVLKDVLLTLGAEDDDYRKHVDQVTLTPTATSQSWTGLGRNSHTDVSTATWSCTLNYAQDWETPDSLSRYLFEHEGETVPAVFAPRAAGGPSFLVDLVLTPGAIGGSVNAFATATVTLGCSGKPALVDAPVGP